VLEAWRVRQHCHAAAVGHADTLGSGPLAVLLHSWSVYSWPCGNVLPTHSNGTVGARMTLKQYLAAWQVVVRPDGREHLLEQFLDGKRWRRNVTLGPSHFMRLLAPLPAPT